MYELRSFRNGWLLLDHLVAFSRASPYVAKPGRIRGRHGAPLHPTVLSCFPDKIPAVIRRDDASPCAPWRGGYLLFMKFHGWLLSRPSATANIGHSMEAGPVQCF
jgi:hypothetical protein